MTDSFRAGSWPVMLTAFNDDRSIDFDGVDALTDWYLGAGSPGLFAACLSSEAHLMTPDEIVAVSRRVIDRAAGRAPVAAGAMGEMADGPRADLVKKLHAAGAAVVVLVSNAFAGETEADSVMESRLLRLADACPGVALGLYECPVPYKRLVPPATLGRLARDGRFVWMKETSCDAAVIQAKLDATRGTNLAFYNANLDLMRETIRMGGHGFSGIFANFFPDLVADLSTPESLDDPHAEDLFGLVKELNRDLVERHVTTSYPMLAKLAAQLQGVKIGTTCRGAAKLTDAAVADLHAGLARVNGVRGLAGKI